MGTVGNDGIGGVVKGGVFGVKYGSDGVVPSLPSVGTVVYSFSGVESGRGEWGSSGGLPKDTRT